MTTREIIHKACFLDVLFKNSNKKKGANHKPVLVENRPVLKK